MLQDPVERPKSVANFDSELVQDQLPHSLRSLTMLSLYTNLMTRLHTNEKGATAVEYGIMVGLIAVVIIVAVGLLGGTLNNTFNDIQCQVAGKGPYIPASGATAGACTKP